MSAGRRGRGRGSGRRVSFRGGGLLRHKRRPSSRDGGFLRSDRRADARGGEDERPSTDDRDGEEYGRDGAPEVRIRRGGRSGSPPVARVTTLVLLLLLVLAVIFLL